MKIMKLFIKDGNFASWLRAAFILLGGGIIYVGITYYSSMILMSFGLFIAALGGYSSRAKTSGLKPCDNTYKKKEKNSS
jgi:hypothetical protein